MKGIIEYISQDTSELDMQEVLMIDIVTVSIITPFYIAALVVMYALDLISMGGGVLFLIASLFVVLIAEAFSMQNQYISAMKQLNAVNNKLITAMRDNADERDGLIEKLKEALNSRDSTILERDALIDHICVGIAILEETYQKLKQQSDDGGDVVIFDCYGTDGGLQQVTQ